MPGLRVVHVVVLFISIILTAGPGTWALMNGAIAAGVVSLAASVVLVLYAAYFAARASATNLD